MLNVVKEASTDILEAAGTETTPPFDGKIQATPQEVATPNNVPVSSDLETPEIIESYEQHIAIGTSDSKIHPECRTRSTCVRWE